jgi:hypothetical protein
MKPVIDWLSRKLAQPIATIYERRTVRVEYRKHHGGRYSVAALTVHVEPAETFALRIPLMSDADSAWAVEDAILTTLLAHYRKPVLGLSITVADVVEDEVGSSYNAFRNATLDAMNQALLTESGDTNIKWE